MKKYIFVYLIFLTILLVMSFIYALFLQLGKWSTDYRKVLDGTFVIMAISSFILGLLFCNIKQKKALINSFISVFPIILILFIVNFKELNTAHYIRYLIIIVSSLIGGCIGVKLPEFKRNI